MESGNPVRAQRILYVLAGAGLLWWLVDAWLHAFPWQDGDGYSLAAAGILVVGVSIAVAAFLRVGGRTLLRNPILLVPYGVLTLLQMTVGLSAALSFMTAGSGFSLLSISVDVSLYLIVLIVLAIAYAAWVTRILLDLRATGRVSIVPTAPVFVRDCVRAAIFMTVGVVGLMIPAGAAITWVGGSVSIWLLPIWGLIWNGLTVAFLPMALAAPSVGAGFRAAAAAARMKGLWGIVVLHLVLIGFIVYFHVSGVTVTENTTIKNGTTTHTTNTESWTRSGTYTEAVWTGGFESDFRWHDKLMANIVRSRAWPPAALGLGLLAAALAIVVKIEVVRRLRLDPPPAPPSDSV